jgi:hypothetical protein
MTYTFAATGETLAYSVEQVAAGKFLRDLILRNDSSAAWPATCLDHYSAQTPPSLRALHGDPPARPPIRHVGMVYGSHLPTAERAAYVRGNNDGVASVREQLTTDGDGTVSAASLDWARTWHFPVGVFTKAGQGGGSRGSPRWYRAKRRSA